ncbi:hypothetical protein AB5I41_23710 [Sphingomonas sp. MMS24-JH45]
MRSDTETIAHEIDGLGSEMDVIRQRMDGLHGAATDYLRDVA